MDPLTGQWYPQTLGYLNDENDSDCKMDELTHTKIKKRTFFGVLRLDNLTTLTWQMSLCYLAAIKMDT